MSDGVVKGYTTIEDAFVNRYLTKDDETIADAKERLKKEQAERKRQSVEKKEARSETTRLRKEEHKKRYSKEVHYEN